MNPRRFSSARLSTFLLAGVLAAGVNPSSRAADETAVWPSAPASASLKRRQSIERVTFWGVDDGESWRRQSSPLLFDDQLQRKPAYNAVIAVAAEVGK